jgi:hypothetical protein
MYTTYLHSKKATHGIVSLALGTILLGSCSRAHQLGVEDNPQAILNRKLNDHTQNSPPTKASH